MKDLSQLDYLIIAKHKSDYSQLANMLKDLGIAESQLHWFQSTADVPHGNFDLIFCDLSDNNSGKPETLSALREKYKGLPVVAITAFEQNELAKKAIHSGAYDFLRKGEYDNTHLYKAIVNALQRQNLNSALAESRNDFELIFDSTPLPIIIYDRESLNIFRVNQAATELYGYSAEEMCALSISDIHPVKHNSHRQKPLEYHLESGTLDGPYFVHLTKSKQELQVEVSLQKYQAESGERVIVSVKNITKRVEAEKELKQTKIRFECAAQATSDIIYDWDLKKNRLEWKGKTISKYYEDRGPVNVKQWVARIHPDDRPDFIGLNSEILNGIQLEEEWETSYRLKNQNGKYSQVLDRAIILYDEENRPARIIGALEDITEKVKTQKTLEISEKKYHLLFDESPLPKFLCHADTLEILQVNHVAKKVITASKTSGDNFFELLSKGDRATFKKMITNASANEIFNLGEWSIFQASENRPLSLKLNMHLIESEGKKQILFAGTDVTELEEIRLSLQNYIDRYKLALKATQDSIWDLDFSSGKLSWADNFTTTFGHEPRAVNNLDKWLDHLHPKDRENIEKSFDQAIKSQNLRWHAHYRFRKSDGSYAYVHDQCSIVYDEKGKALRAVGSLHDESKKVERNRRLRLMEKVVATANDPILITEAEPIDKPGPHIVYANKAFLNQTGYTLEEVIGQSPRILQGPKTDRNALNQLKQAMHRWEAHQIETINYKKNGDEFWVEFSVVPIANETGYFTHWISIQRDTSERANMAEIREAFRKMNMAVSQPGSMAERYQAVLSEILNYTGFDAAEGWIIDLNNTQLNRVCGTYQTPELKQFLQDSQYLDDLKKGEGLPGVAWKEGEVIYWHDLPNHRGFIRKSVAKDNNIHSSAAIPIHRDNALVGVICLFSKHNLHRIKPYQPFLKRLSSRFGAELKRLRTEDELKTIFDLTPNFLFVINLTGEIKKGNAAFASLLNMSEVELVDRSFSSMIPNDFKQEFEEFLTILAKSNQSEEIDLPVNIEGEVKWLNLTAVQQSNDPLIYCVGRDITQQKHQDDILAEAHKMARLGTWEVNLVKNEIYWSPETRLIHEVADDFQPDLDTAIKFYKEGTSRELVQEKVEKTIKSEIEGWEFDAEIVTTTGKSKWVRAQGQVERLEGKVTRMYGSFQDINQRKIAEKQLADAILRKDLAARAAKIGVWDWNIKTDTLVWDNIMYDLYGTHRDNFDGAYQAWLQGVHPDDRAQENSKVERALAGEEDFDTQFRIIHPNTQEVRYIRGIAQVERDESGAPLRMVGVNYDVTDEVENLNKVEELFREREDILESITDGFFSVDKNWTVTYWNKAAEKILKKAKDDILGKNLWEEYPDAKSLKYYSEYHQSVNENEVRRFVEYYPAERVWTEVSCFPKENGLAVYFKNITEQVAHEQNITKLKRLQEHVVNSTHDFIWAIDKNRILILANNAYLNAMEEFYNVKYEVGKPIISFTEQNWHAEDNDKEQWRNAYNSVLKEGNEGHFTYTMKNRLGTNLIFKLSFYPIRDEATPSEVDGVACFARDITERVKHIEAIEEQNEKLKEIAFIQSHLVRAPLARIMALSSLVKNGIIEKDELNEILNHLVASTEELDAVIRKTTKKAAPLKLSK